MHFLSRNGYSGRMLSIAFKLSEMLEWVKAPRADKFVKRPKNFSKEFKIQKLEIKTSSRETQAFNKYFELLKSKKKLS